MPTDLAEYEFELDGVRLGGSTPILVDVFEPGGKPDQSVQDSRLPGVDGVRMGRDYLDGAVYTVEGLVNEVTADAGWATWRALRKAWDSAATRNTPGAVLPWRMRMPGQDTVRVYGRPRRIAPTNTKHTRVGVIPFAADFQAVDHLVYSDTEHVLSISGNPINYQNTAGTTTPHVPPVTLAEAVLPSDVATNAGNAPTWPVVTFHGPRERPGLVWVGRNLSVSLALVLGDGQSVTVDTRPWARTVLRGDGASVAGALRGSRLSDLVLAPGDTQLSFEGEDSTLTSRVDIAWRDANGSL